MENFFSLLLFIFYMWIVNLIPHIIIFGILAFTKSIRSSLMHEKNYVILSLLIPMGIEILLLTINGAGKSFGNVLVEPFLIGLFVALLNCYFIITGDAKKYWILGMLIIPICVYFLMPWLPY